MKRISYICVCICALATLLHLELVVIVIFLSFYFAFYNFFSYDEERVAQIFFSYLTVCIFSHSCANKITSYTLLLAIAHA